MVTLRQVHHTVATVLRCNVLSLRDYWYTGGCWTERGFGDSSFGNKVLLSLLTSLLHLFSIVL